jgi:hypothetical protein
MLGRNIKIQARPEKQNLSAETWMKQGFFTADRRKRRLRRPEILTVEHADIRGWLAETE